jgi:hypothetical protein
LIRAAIAEDFFYLWSFPYEQSNGLVTSDVTPLCFEGRAWLAVAVVRLAGPSWHRLPFARRATVAGLCLLCEYQRGSVQRGNYFLKASSDSRLISFVAGLLRPEYGERAQIRLQPDGFLETPALSLRLGEELPPADQARLVQLFRNNCSGIVRRHDRAFHTALQKDHWKMRGRRLTVERFAWMDGLELRPEFGFDSSTNRGRWSPPRAVR